MQTVKTPAEIASELTGKLLRTSTRSVLQENLRTIAKDAGKLEEFKAQMLEQKKAILDQRVKDGKLTQEQADEIYNAIKNNQANCDGTGSAAIGRKYGAGFGLGSGMGNGQGAGRGAGMRNGYGMGAGRGMNR